MRVRTVTIYMHTVVTVSIVEHFITFLKVLSKAFIGLLCIFMDFLKPTEVAQFQKKLFKLPLTYCRIC